jgi:L-threonylcarbamoyladenylate synthase
MVRILVHPEQPEAAAIERAAAVLRSGGVAVIPTDTLYGLAANPFDAAAVDRVFAIKGRLAERALPLVAASADQVREWIGALPPMGERLAARFWPGPLTLVVAAPRSIAPAVTGGGPTVGVRVPDSAVARALCAASGVPLTATSANRSGALPTREPDVAAEALGADVDVLIDAGATPGGAPSTIVDVTGAEPQLIRAGAIAWDDVLGCVARA